MTTPQQTPQHNVSRNKSSATKLIKSKLNSVLRQLKTAIKLIDNEKSEDPSTYDRTPNLPILNTKGIEVSPIDYTPSSLTKPSYSSVLE